MKSEDLTVPIGRIVCPENHIWETSYITNAINRNLIITGMQFSGKTTLARKYINNLIYACNEQSVPVPKVVVLESLDIEDRPNWKEPVGFRNKNIFHSVLLYANESDTLPKINIWKIPDGIEPHQWIEIVVDMFCHTFHFLQRGRDALMNTVTALYKDAGVWDAEDDSTAQSLSAKITFASIIALTKEQAENKTNSPEFQECNKKLYEALCCSTNPLFADIFTHEQGESISEIIKKGINVFKGKYKGAELHHFLYRCIMMYVAKRKGNDNMILVIDNANDIAESLIDDAIQNRNPLTHFIVLTTGSYTRDTSCLDAFDYIIAGRTPSADYQKICINFSNTDLSEHNVIRCVHPITPTGIFAKIPSKKTDDKPEGIVSYGII